jgi:hypothetical protein
MSILFADAVRTVQVRLEANWNNTVGTPYVSPSGLRDEDDYLVSWGAREWLVDENPDYLLMNGVVTFVSIESGQVRDDLMILNFDKVDRMTAIS